MTSEKSCVYIIYTQYIFEKTSTKLILVFVKESFYRATCHTGPYGRGTASHLKSPAPPFQGTPPLHSCAFLCTIFLALLAHLWSSSYCGCLCFPLGCQHDFQHDFQPNCSSMNWNGSPAKKQALFFCTSCKKSPKVIFVQ